jgi:hypothetical protein
MDTCHDNKQYVKEEHVTNLIFKASDPLAYGYSMCSYKDMLIKRGDDVEICINCDDGSIIFNYARILFFVVVKDEPIKMAINWYYMPQEFFKVSSRSANKFKPNELLFSNTIQYVFVETINRKVDVVFRRKYITNDNFYCKRTIKIENNILKKYHNKIISAHRLYIKLKYDNNTY